MNSQCCLFREMKNQEVLVWDSYTGELISFVDLDDVSTNYATQQLKTHILVFLAKIINYANCLESRLLSSEN